MRTSAENVVRNLILVGVGAAGAAVGFRHTHDWAVENGQTQWIAWVIAVVIECMVIIAGLEIRRQPGRFPIAVLVAAFLLQMAAQVSSARDTVAGWLLAATPALGFLIIVKLSLRTGRAAPVPAPMPVDQVPAEHHPVMATSQREDVRPVDHAQVREIPPAAPVVEPVQHVQSAAWPPS